MRGGHITNLVVRVLLVSYRRIYKILGRTDSQKDGICFFVCCHHVFGRTSSVENQSVQKVLIIHSFKFTFGGILTNMVIEQTIKK